MNSKELKLGLIPAIILCLLAFASLSTATYAWFTRANREVFTSKANGVTASAEVKLLLSTSQDFSAKKSETAIAQVNGFSAEKLMPVSTDDLVHFVTSFAIDGGNAQNFKLVSNEENYYHGRIYLKAEGATELEDQKMKLYWNAGKGGGEPLSNMTGELQCAARLGLAFRGEDMNQTRILSLSTANIAGSKMNTSVDGVEQSGGIVLHGAADGSVRAVTDPSRLWSDFAVHDGQQLPATPLCTLSLNKVYSLDIYFYLEGCDPDCLNDISMNGADLTLWFYGQLAIGGQNET